MHEFIIPILILVLIAYLFIPTGSVYGFVHSAKYRLSIAAVATLIIFSILTKLEMLNIVFFVLPVLVITIRLLSNKRTSQIIIIFVVSLLVITSALKLTAAANYLGVLFYVLMLGFASKNIIYNEDK